MSRDDLAAFVRDRLDEQEHGARELRRRAQEHRRAVKEQAVLGTHVPGWHDWPKVDQVCATVLAQVAANRRIVDDHAGLVPDFWCQADSACKDPDDRDLRERMPCRYVRWVVAIFSTHPDYREEWAPDAD